MIRVAIPGHLRRLAGRDDRPIDVDVDGTPTIASIIDVLERDYPALRGTIRDPATGRRRDFIRFFGGGRDLSRSELSEPLPDEFASGREVFRIVGGIAGG